MNDALEEAKAEFTETTRAVHRPEETPVDVARTPDDRELDDHLWMRMAAVVADYARASVEPLPADVRAYFLTRLFERETARGGADAFLYAAPELIDLVAPAYRHLGLDSVADAFQRYATAEPTRRLLANGAWLTDAEFDALRRLVAAIGNHDGERIAFVRAHRDSFDR